MEETSYFEASFIEKLKNCDFFAGGKDQYSLLLEHQSFLVHGAHKEPAPLVSVVITTYKRPQWLKTALESALRQEGFSDYEIIIVDNEGKPIDEETETSRLVRSFASDKIVYYRNVPSVLHKTQRAVSCSRSQWFCILHDDDFLAKDHLRTMVGILREHPQISYLACSPQSFDSDEEANFIEKAQRDTKTSSKIIRYPAKSACAACYPGWLGALIKREDYENMGGMYLEPLLSPMIGDYIMVMKFMNRYDSVYRHESDTPLYFYRVSAEQASARGGIYWVNAYVSEYYLYEYMAKKYHPLFFSFWKYIGNIVLYEKIEDKTGHKWLGNTPFDWSTLCLLTGLPYRDIGGKRFALEKKLLAYIRVCYLYGCKSLMLHLASAVKRRLFRRLGLSAARPITL